MPCKVIIFWSLFGNGWQEVYYRSIEDPKEASNFTEEQRRAFYQLHHPEIVWQATRASLIGSPRQSYLRVYNDPTLPILDTTTLPKPDITNSCARVRLTDNTLHTRYVWWRGMYDNDIERDPLTGASLPTDRWRTAFNNWKALLPNMALSIRYRTPVGGAPLFNWQPVLSFQADLTFTSRTRINLAAGFTAPIKGDVIYFQHVDQTQMPGLVGNFTVVDAGALTATINYRYKNKDAIFFPTRTAFRKYAPNYTQLNTAEFMKFATRQTGKVTTSDRGRRSGISLRF